eukprot:TRINITY_DN2904_c0_g2_i1.p1 TRINITY_DN2904_c0_g2~~TRINITY_DN2904_c0_g2_i1.p1  ORF type:complete len:415 (+),score=67.19 TRINITY_DN2904_c0_g2_i1:48-1292(+)
MGDGDSDASDPFYIDDEDDQHPCVKINGVSMYRVKKGKKWPFDAYQLLNWAAVVISILMHSVIHLPMAGEVAGVVFGFIVPLGITMSVCVGFGAMLIQPASPAVFGSKRWSREQFEESQKYKHPGIDTTQLVFCVNCHVWVGREAKHCHTCNKCIDGFDHHCKFVNACIGSANYAEFAFFSIITMVTALAQAIFNVLLFTGSFTSESSYKARFDFTYGEYSDSRYAVWRAFLVISFVQDCVLFCLLVHLMSFHFSLLFKTVDIDVYFPVVLPPEWNGSLAKLGIEVDWSKKCRVKVIKGSQMDKLGVKDGYRLSTVLFDDPVIPAPVDSQALWEPASQYLVSRAQIDVDVVFIFKKTKKMSTYDHLMLQECGDETSRSASPVDVEMPLEMEMESPEPSPAAHQPLPEPDNAPDS